MTMYYNQSTTDSMNIRAEASNVRPGSNPAYTLADFVAFYPQFGDATPIPPALTGVPLIPDAVIQAYIDLAAVCIMETRWHGLWKIATSWFIAHFCTLYLEALVHPDSGAAAVISAGQARGIIASESASDVSASYDNSMAADLNGWAGWKLTTYGIQLATHARIVGMGGMMV